MRIEDNGDNKFRVSRPEQKSEEMLFKAQVDLMNLQLEKDALEQMLFQTQTEVLRLKEGSV